MKQNKYFSMGRFARLFRNDLMINQKTYFFAMVGISIALFTITYSLMRSNTRFNENDFTALFLMYLMGIGVLIGTGFPAFSSSTKTNHYLLIPASSFEKFLVQFVIRIILLMPIALGIFWIDMHMAKATMIPDLANGFDPATQIKDFHFNMLFNQIDPGHEIKMFILSLFSVSTILFAGSAFFNRFALVKTLIVSAIIVFTVYCSFVFFSHIFYPEVVHGFDVHLNHYVIDGDNLNNLTFLGYIIGGLSWLFFLPLAYFKLKEKEV